MVGTGRGRRRPGGSPSKIPFVGVGGDPAERVGEARRYWTKARQDIKKLREEEDSGFTFLNGAVYEERLWRARLAEFGIEGRDGFVYRIIPGARQARTDEELSARNSAFGSLWLWQPVALAGRKLYAREWGELVLSSVAAGFRGLPGPDPREWRKSLSPKLFDVLARAFEEAFAEVYGYLMENIPKDPAGERGNYVLAGMVWACRGAGTGDRRRTALSVLAGNRSPQARTAQYAQELAGATRIAWSEREANESLTDLADRVVGYIEKAGDDEVFFKRERQVDPAWNRAVKSPKRTDPDAPGPPAEHLLARLLADGSAEANPEVLITAPEERDELEEKIARHELTTRQAEVARLRNRRKTARQIGDDLGISENTVYSHLKDIRERKPRGEAAS